jgi:hypothetical protein
MSFLSTLYSLVLSEKNSSSFLLYRFAIATAFLACERTSHSRFSFRQGGKPGDLSSRPACADHVVPTVRLGETPDDVQ